MGEDDSRSSSCPSFEFRPPSPRSPEESSALPQSEEQQERQPSTLHFITHRLREGGPLRQSIHHLRPQSLGIRSLVSRRDCRKLPTLPSSSHCPPPKPTGVQKNNSEAVLMMGTNPHVPGDGEGRVGVSQVQDCSPGVTTVPMGVQPAAIPRLFLFLYHSPTLPQLHSGGYSRSPEPYSFTSRSQSFQPAFGHQCSPDTVSQIDPQRSQLFPSAQAKVAVPARDSCPGIAFAGKLKVVLCNHNLWLMFHRHQNEMIVTKRGRLMFPSLVYQIQGMDPIAHYRVYMEMVLIDEHRWRYQMKEWVQYKKEENNVPENQLYIHPDSPNTGANWMGQEIAFRKLRLTNTKETSNDQMITLKSCHKYQPKLHIEELRERENGTLSPSASHIFTFPETQFFAVTMYQNTEIVQLKINHNCFASSFRKKI